MTLAEDRPAADPTGAPAAAPVWPGRHDPLGATWSAESTNFAVFAPEATAIEVCLFDE